MGNSDPPLPVANSSNCGNEMLRLIFSQPPYDDTVGDQMRLAFGKGKLIHMSKCKFGSC